MKGLVEIRYRDGSEWRGAFSSPDAGLAFAERLRAAGFTQVKSVELTELPESVDYRRCDECGSENPWWVGEFTVRLDPERGSIGTPGEKILLCHGRPESCMDRWVEPWMLEELAADYLPAGE